jgi:predicted ATPase
MKGRCFMKDEALSIDKIIIKNLFNRDNTIEISIKTSLSFMLGPNGFGKTIIMKLLTSVFANGEYNYQFDSKFFMETPFNEFTVKLSNGIDVIVRKKRDIVEFIIKKGEKILEVRTFEIGKDDYEERRVLLYKYNSFLKIVYIGENRTRCAELIIDKMGQHYTGTTPFVYSTLKDIMKKRSAFHNVNIAENKHGYIEFTIGGKPISIDRVSPAIADELYIFACILHENERYNAEQGAILFCIDTPETCKHISIQQMFANDVIKYMRGNATVIIATQSPYITIGHNEFISDIDVT